MNKEVQKIQKTLNEKEAQRTARVEKARAELKETQEELSKLRASLTTAANRAEFTSIYSEVQKLEAVEKFCETRLKETDSEAIVTAEECEKIKKDIQSAYDKILTDTKPGVLAKIDELISAIQAPADDITELNNLLQLLSRLRHTSFAPLSVGALGFSADPFDRHGPFFAAYFKYKENELRLSQIQGKQK